MSSLVIELPDNKHATAHWDDGEFVQIEIRDEAGEELVMWHADEFEDDPVLVVGAMLSAMGGTTVEIRSIRDSHLT